MADPQVADARAVTTVDDEDLGPPRMQNIMFRFAGFDEKLTLIDTYTPIGPDGR